MNATSALWEQSLLEASSSSSSSSSSHASTKGGKFRGVGPELQGVSSAALYGQEALLRMANHPMDLPLYLFLAPQVARMSLLFFVSILLHYFYLLFAHRIDPIPTVSFTSLFGCSWFHILSFYCYRTLLHLSCVKPFINFLGFRAVEMHIFLVYDEHVPTARARSVRRRHRKHAGRSARKVQG